MTITGNLAGCAGTYVLVAVLARPASLRAGRLGRRVLPQGWYLYVGSALGPGGIAARCGRHARKDKKLRWHVDHLLTVARLREIWYRCGTAREEHCWAGALDADPSTAVAWPGFGASDCHCPSHLWRTRSRPAMDLLTGAVGGRGLHRVFLED